MPISQLNSGSRRVVVTVNTWTDEARQAAAASRHAHAVGDKLTYTGRAGSMPAEFRGFHHDPMTGEKMARVIVRPDDEPPFEASVNPSELSAGKVAGEKPAKTSSTVHIPAKEGNGRSYRGWTIEKHETVGQGVRAGVTGRRPIKTGKNAGGQHVKHETLFHVSHPEHYPNGRYHKTLKAAKAHVDDFEGPATNAESGTATAPANAPKLDPVAAAKADAEQAAERHTQIEQQAMAEQAAADAKTATKTANTETAKAHGYKAGSPASRKAHGTAAIAHRDASSAWKAQAGPKSGNDLPARAAASQRAEQHAKAAKSHEMMAQQGSLAAKSTFNRSENDMKMNTGSRGVVANVSGMTANTWSDAARAASAEKRKSGWTAESVTATAKQPYASNGPNGLRIKIKKSKGNTVHAAVTTKTGTHEMKGTPQEAADHINKHVDEHMGNA